MNKEPKEGKLKVYASYGLLTLIFFVDCFLSLSFFGGIPYVIGLVLVMWLLPPQEMMRFGFVCGVVALLGFFSPPAEIQDNMGGLMTRFMAIFTVIAIAILTRREADVATKQEEEKKLLNSVIEKRTNGLKQVVDQFDEVKIRLSEAEQLGHFGFWEFYPSSQQMIWSNGMFGIYGYPVSPQAPSFQEFLNLTHVDDLQILQNSIDITLTEKKPSAVEYRAIMPDGSFKWLYYKGRPVINNDNHIENIVGTIQDITLLKQSAHQTDVNTAKYTTLFQSAAIPKALFIPDKRILEVNTAFCKWVGYHEKELLKIPIEKLMHKDDRSMEDAYAKDIIQGDLDVYRKEKRFVRKNGQIVWGIFNVAAVLDANKRVSYFSAEIVDTTRLKAAEVAQKKAEEAWHEAEEALTEIEAEKRIASQQGTPANGVALTPDMEEELEKAYGMAEEVIDHIFEVSRDMLAILGEDGFYKRVSPAMGQLLGYQPEQLDDQTMIDLIHPNEQEIFYSYQAQLFSGHPSNSISVRHQKADGSYAWFSLQATFNPDHEVAYIQFKETEPLPDSAQASLKIEATKPTPPEPSPPVQRDAPEEPSTYTPPVFIEAEEDKKPFESEPRQSQEVQEEEAYPSIEDHLAQLYGEVDPSKVFFEPEPSREESNAKKSSAPPQEFIQDDTNTEYLESDPSPVPKASEQPSDSFFPELDPSYEEGPSNSTDDYPYTPILDEDPSDDTIDAYTNEVYETDLYANDIHASNEHSEEFVDEHSEVQDMQPLSSVVVPPLQQAPCSCR